MHIIERIALWSILVLVIFFLFCKETSGYRTSRVPAPVPAPKPAPVPAPKPAPAPAPVPAPKPAPAPQTAHTQTYDSRPPPAPQTLQGFRWSDS